MKSGEMRGALHPELQLRGCVCPRDGVPAGVTAGTRRASPRANQGLQSGRCGDGSKGSGRGRGDPGEVLTRALHPVGQGRRGDGGRRGPEPQPEAEPSRRVVGDTVFPPDQTAGLSGAQRAPPPGGLAQGQSSLPGLQVGLGGGARGPAGTRRLQLEAGKE